jgi:hypothetical protein
MFFTSIYRQCRFDCGRVGMFTIGNAVMMLAFPVFSLVVAVALNVIGVDDGVSGGLMGGICGVSAMMTWMVGLSPAVAEESGNHRAMDGLIPVARRAQVVGRFLFLLLSCALWAVDVMVCSAAFVAMGEVPDIGWSVVVSVGASVFALGVILGSIMLACSYRFAFSQMVMVFGVAVAVIYAIVALASLLPFDWASVLYWIADFLSAWWRTALIVGVLCVATYVISMAAAVLIYRNKEL